MGLQVKEKVTYINIKAGAIYLNDKPYDFLMGFLTKIDLRDRYFNGEEVKYWYFNFSTTGEEVYSLGIPYRSGTAISLLNYLASVSDFEEPIKVTPYLKGKYTKLTVYSGEKKLSWRYEELPPIEKIKVADQTVKDDSKRMELMLQIAEKINNKCSQ